MKREIARVSIGRRRGNVYRVHERARIFLADDQPLPDPDRPEHVFLACSIHWRHHCRHKRAVLRAALGFDPMPRLPGCAVYWQVEPVEAYNLLLRAGLISLPMPSPSRERSAPQPRPARPASAHAQPAEAKKAPAEAEPTDGLKERFSRIELD